MEKEQKKDGYEFTGWFDEEGNKYKCYKYNTKL